MMNPVRNFALKFNFYQEIKKAMNSKISNGMKKCGYYPCHKNLKNCRYCFCPLYPCGDCSTGGKLIRNKNRQWIWSCRDCDWIHQNKIVKKVSQYFKNSSKKNYALEDLFFIKMELLGLKSKTFRPSKKFLKIAENIDSVKNLSPDGVKKIL